MRYYIFLISVHLLVGASPIAGNTVQGESSHVYVGYENSERDDPYKQIATRQIDHFNLDLSPLRRNKSQNTKLKYACYRRIPDSRIDPIPGLSENSVVIKDDKPDRYLPYSNVAQELPQRFNLHVCTTLQGAEVSYACCKLSEKHFIV